jgi:hypothetical protein
LETVRFVGDGNEIEVGKTAFIFLIKKQNTNSGDLHGTLVFIRWLMAVEQALSNALKNS